MTTTATLSRNVLGSFAALVLGMTFVGAATAPAHAATMDVTTISVSSSDLNMASPAGQSAYAGRVKAAAKTVCATDLNDVASRTAEQNCIDAAVAAGKAAATKA
ncbi:UrcA family protein [Polymorphobacter arshaanensis]|uniref:UrcA family protein n=1 Tax=Glacieibacterium arshaanense TaxID=2511025 RepID=A0A4Y9ENP1_9SPHN|nr:UrcA family protein [Polymorphobacter arshaanensis]TFU03657.1 UrcA family protein [Polymorphobacter arshaanensis]